MTTTPEPDPMTEAVEATAGAITDEEWREFQAIPEQGYSHRAWFDHLIADRVQTALPILRAQFAEEVAGAIDAERVYDSISRYAMVTAAAIARDWGRNE